MAKKQKLIDVHAQALREFDKIQSAQFDERHQALNDRRFYSIAGAQWEGKLGRQFENSPKIEINKVHLSVIRIINEYRNNRITVDFIPKDGSQNDNLSDLCDGLYRADEQDSNANEAYDNAFEESVGGGIGAWRLRAEYEDEYDEENEKQRIKIEPIYDADTSVYFDLDAKKYDKSDAKFAFVIYSMEHEAFKDKWGDDPSTWPKELLDNIDYDWYTPNVVYVAEYYRVEDDSETVHTYLTISGEEEKYRDSDFETDPELEDQLEAIGSIKISERKIKKQRVRKYLMAGNRILEDQGYVAGRYIPIVPNFGKRWFVENIERSMGHVRLAKDAQRLKNMQMSKLVEIAATSPIERPIVTPEQISGHQNMWASSNIERYPYLLLNPTTDKEGNEVPAGPLSYIKPPSVPPATAALLQITDQDMKEVLGNQEAGEEILSGVSGKAYEMIQTRLDMQTFIYMDNMAKSMKRCGEIWLEMAKELYIEPGRKMKVVNQNKEVSQIELSRKAMDQDTKEQILENDLSKASMDVTVTVGPSSSSKRASTVQAIMGMMQLSTNDPQTMSILTSMAMSNMEGEGIEDVREYFRRLLVRQGVYKPTEEEAKQMEEELANKPEDPNSKFLNAAAAEAEAKAAKGRADTLLTLKKAEQTEAETAKTKTEVIENLTEIESQEIQNNLGLVEQLG